jgi:SAM-dependent methyltransferase
MDKRTTCPICEGAIRPHAAEEGRPGRERVAAPGAEPTAETWTFSQCDACGHVFVNPPAYASTGYEEAVADPELHPWSFTDRRAYLSLVLEEFFRLAGRQKLRILDFGCGYGLSVSVFNELGQDCVGYDPAVKQVQYGRDKFGIEAHCGDWERTRAKIGIVDAVFTQNVFEHVDAPLMILKSVRDCLRPGGVLALVVPNFLRAAEPYSPPEHLHYYSAKSVAELVKRAGFDVRHVSRGRPGVEKFYRLFHRLPPLWAIHALDRMTAGASLHGYNLSIFASR